MSESILNSSTERGRLVNSNVYVEEKSEHRPAKHYFLEEEEKALNSFIQQSKIIFKKTGDIFSQRYESETDELNKSRGGELKKLIERDSKEFQAYCMLKRKVDHKKEIIGNFANMIHQKNWLKTVFHAWKTETKAIKHRAKMTERADIYHSKRMMRVVLKSWQSIMIQNNRVKIKNEVLRKTDQEINRVQRQYQKIIEELERTLSNKLLDLKKEEEQHKLLHDKYEAMYSRQRHQ